MKRILLYTLLFTGSFFVSRAQDQQPEDASKRQEKIKALYVAYVTQQLNLTEDEAKKFWPVHEQFQQEIKSVSMDMPELERQQSLLNIKKKYQDRFTAILGGSRANNFYRLHGEFINRLVEEHRKRKQQNMNQRPGRRRQF